MAIHDYILDNENGANFRADLNSALSAIVSNNSSATEPTTTFAYMFWTDTTTAVLKQRNSANTGWVDILNLTTGAGVAMAINDLTDAVVDGLDNMGLGANALISNITGFNNIAIGLNALKTNTTGSSNVAIGLNALILNTVGINNTAAGDGALINNTIGNNNAAYGKGALSKNTGGINNTALGVDALFDNTTGSQNTAVGITALDSNTTGSDNTAVGANALISNTIGNNNVAVGRNALANNTSNDNTAVGTGALISNTIGNNNVAVGRNALPNNTSGFDAIAVGDSALAMNTVGSEVIAIGLGALPAHTTGSRNIGIGNNAAHNITTENHSISIGHDIQSVGSFYFTFGESSGSNRVYNNFAANATWTRASDIRIKKEIENNEDCGLGFINDLRTVTYKFKAPNELDAEMSEYDENNDKPSHDKRMYGFIAQEVKEVLDNHDIKDFAGWHVDKNGKDNLQGISYEMFVMPLVKAVQELSAKNEALESTLANLTARLDALEK